MKLITKQLEKALAKYPLYSQDGKGDKRMAVAKFFRGSYTWYVLEGEKKPNGKYDFYGIVDNNGEREEGYFSQDEFEAVNRRYMLGVERDMYFKPTSVGKVKAQLDKQYSRNITPTTSSSAAAKAIGAAMGGGK